MGYNDVTVANCYFEGYFVLLKRADEALQKTCGWRLFVIVKLEITFVLEIWLYRSGKSSEPDTLGLILHFNYMHSVL